MKKRFKSLVSAEEAIELVKHRDVSDIDIVLDVVKAHKEKESLSKIPDKTGLFLMMDIWNAGRIQGMREVRAKRKGQVTLCK